MATRIVLDAQVCQGYGVCVQLAPEYFELPAGTMLAYVTRDVVDDADREAILDAVELCPLKALRLIEDD